MLTIKGRPRLGIPPIAKDVAVLQQDSAFNTVYAAQPITALLKVRQGVKLAQADQHIAQAQLQKGTREVLAGVEQLFWGLLATQRIRAGTLVALGAAEELAKTGNLEARTAVVQTRQGLLEVEGQIADLQGQLAVLIDLPPCTCLELIEPPPPVVSVSCCDEAVHLALASSPEIQEAEQNINKAHAAVAAAKVDYLPNVAVVGGYLNQTAASYIQPNIGYVGVVGSYTFLDWGKRKNTLRERENLVCLTKLKLQQTQDEVRQKAVKAFQDYQGSQAALQLAGDLVALRKEAEKAAVLPAAKFTAAKDRMTAEVDYVKADLAQRVAAAKLHSLLGGE